ncbi:hypothetical protein [Streptomyces sp. SAJ15]|uniref:hypothetical protein n=1 Tax=Streptomyces sp. SAJ15 TaxID=2011095 RepID=UPI00118677F2|nr:hypothetical protein [Streptomyces sp. SAJ15]TVL93675.1 hypothetical protein CD790_01015 [Streptomyces sp. SAJ15]
MPTHEPPAVATRRDKRPSMSDLLASCAAASAVSTPPEQPTELVRQAASGASARRRPDDGERSEGRDAA